MEYLYLPHLTDHGALHLQVPPEHHVGSGLAVLGGDGLYVRVAQHLENSNFVKHFL